MDDRVACNGNGRRLPSWMFGVHKPSEAQDLGNDDVDNKSKDEEIDNGKNLMKARTRKTKATSEKISKRKLGGDEGEAEEARGEERKRRRKRRDCDVVDGGDDNGENAAIVRLKRKRGGRKRSASNASRTRVDSDDDDDDGEDEGSCRNVDDDLTIRDLMNIAQECVAEDKEATRRTLSLEGGDLTVDDLTSIALECVEEDTRAKGIVSKDEYIAGREVQGAAVTCSGRNGKTLEQRGVDSENRLNGNVTSGGTIVKPTMTGDPTKDMLDLFLGPLLRKPENEQKKLNVIAQDLSFACEIQKPRCSVGRGEEAGPVTKKKSSLKDKVAMFLD